MTNAQRKYLADRLAGIYQTKRRAIEIRHTTPAVELDDEQRLTCLLSNNFAIRGGLDGVSRHDSIGRVFDFGEHPKGLNYAAFEADLESLDEVYNAILDQVYLGSAEDALGSIAKLEALEV